MISNPSNLLNLLRMSLNFTVQSKRPSLIAVKKLILIFQISTIGSNVLMISVKLSKSLQTLLKMSRVEIYLNSSKMLLISTTWFNKPSKTAKSKMILNH